MKKFFFIFLLVSSNTLLAQSDTLLILTEIMFRPTTGNNEFIEIYNRSETETINLTNYKIKYHTSNPNTIVDAGFGINLPPKSYAVIFQGTYDIPTGIYNGIVPPSALILKIATNNFGSAGMANETDRQVWLLNNVNDTLDTYFYTANNPAAISDEKKLLNRDTSRTNWGNSLIQNGTPGFKNTLTPIDFDLSAVSIFLQPSIPIIGENVTVNSVIKNLGINTAASYSVKIYNDLNNDSIGTSNELLEEGNFNNLLPGDSLIFSTQINNIQNQLYRILVQIDFAEDENLTNNKRILNFTPASPPFNYNDIVVNEISYAPVTANGEPEWVELFNNTDSPINIKKWTFADNVSQVTITQNNLFVPAKGYLVLSRDSSILNIFPVQSNIFVLTFPALNNTDDAVVIKDSLGTLIDSVRYFSAWGGSSGGRTLERILVEGASNNPANWGTSQSPFRGTPGSINSLSPKEFDLTVSRFRGEKNFAIIGENINLTIEVKNLGTNQSGQFLTEIFFDANNDSIGTPDELIFSQNSNPLNSNDSLIFNINVQINNAGANRFIAKVTTDLDQDTTNNKLLTSISGVVINEVRGDIIINEIMYAPTSPEPEWIELHNISNKIINLFKYKIADNGDTSQVISVPFNFNPGEFVVIARDTSVKQYYSINAPVFAASFPVLNNDIDKVLILDSLNRVIDSLQYRSVWGGTGGRSLERINPLGNSTDSTNWRTSIGIVKATPGRINSVTQKNFDIAVENIIFNPTAPLLNDNVTFQINIKNIGKNNADYSLMVYYDSDGDSIPDNEVANLTGLSIQVGESVFVPIDFTINNISSKVGIYAKAIFNMDEDTLNNSLYKNVEPGFPPLSLVINEIMYTPQAGEPEWVEIYNRSESPININGWRISDILTTPATVTVNRNVVINPGTFLVIARDSSINNYYRSKPENLLILSLPVLNNDADGVVLKDNRGVIIDSVFYNSSWGGTGGISLERRDTESPSNNSANWTSSVSPDNGTPGFVNSIVPKDYDLTASGISFEPIYPVSGDQLSVSILIKNNGLLNAENFSFELYLFDNFNGTTELKATEQIGLLASGDSLVRSYPAIVPALNNLITFTLKVNYNEDLDTLNNILSRSIEPGFLPASILINEIMYAPNSGEPEWVEIINVSNDTINLKNWSISDVITPTKAFITLSDFNLLPGDLAVIAQDTSFNSVYPGFSSNLFIAKIGALSNTSDGVVIYDFRNAVIDSVFYRSSWGGRNGKSLERITTTGATNDSTNWITSLTNATPGLPNSTVTIPSYSRNNLIINEIMYEPATTNNEFVEFLNLSGNDVNVGGWRMEDERGTFYRLSDTSLVVPNNNYFVLIADSTVLQNYSSLNNYPYKTVLNVSNLGLVNTGELIMIKDIHNNIIDSVWYFSNWHNRNIGTTRNRSLERINPGLSGNDPSNWSSSVATGGATPAEVNSIFVDNTNLSTNINVFPNPFSPDNDGFEDVTFINYSLSQPVSQIRVKVFDSQGRLVRTLANNQASGSKGTIIFDGRDDNGNSLRIGIYIVFMEALNDNSGVLETLKTTVVVARKLN